MLTDQRGQLTDKLVMAAANITNAPAALTINQVLDIYKCLPTADDFGNDVAVGGTAGGASTGPIIPIAPQTQSGTYGSFKANLDTANGSPVTLGTCVRFAEEHGAPPLELIAAGPEGARVNTVSMTKRRPAESYGAQPSLSAKTVGTPSTG